MNNFVLPLTVQIPTVSHSPVTEAAKPGVCDVSHNGSGRPLQAAGAIAMIMQ